MTAITGHPKGTIRGLITKSAIGIGATEISAITYDSTGAILTGSLRISNQSLALSANSTANSFSSGLRVSGKTVGTLTANSTGLLVADALRVGTKTTYITSNSTGVKLGSKYISTNTTGN